MRIKHQVVAPHPRCTLHALVRRARRAWDAIIKANLPVLVLAGEAEPKVSALRNFDHGARGRQRVDVMGRVEAWAERSLYLPTGGQRPQDNDRPALLTPSTYRLGGIAYVALGEPGARTGDLRRGRSCISTASDTFC